MNYKILETKRKSIAEKIVVGIDPGKETHQAAVLDRLGVHQKTFTFKVNPHGYFLALWKKLDRVIPHQDSKNVVFAIETSCNLWQTLAHYLHYSGYPVLLVSPLTTHYSRAFIDHDFSHTDPKDALLMASKPLKNCNRPQRTPSALSKAGPKSSPASSLSKAGLQSRRKHDNNCKK